MRKLAGTILVLVLSGMGSKAAAAAPRPSDMTTTTTRPQMVTTSADLDSLCSEISGERLWGLFAKRFGTAREFFREHIVMNYCPLAFLEKTGRNRTPDKLPPREREFRSALIRSVP